MSSSPPLSQRQKLLTFAGVLLAMFLSSLDQTIVATALPRIVADLRGLDRFSWVSTAYLIASTALVPIYGKLADMYSRRAIEVVAISIFLFGSALCGLAGEFGPLPLLGDGMTQLVVFRAIQGLGGAGLLGLAFIVIANLFAPAERGRYQGFTGAVFATSSVLGPLLGGLLTDHGTNLIPGVAGWRLVFYVNLPLGALALWFILAFMPPLRPAGPTRPLDYGGAALLISGLVALVLALQLNHVAYPWTSPLTLGLLAGAVGTLTWFVHRSLHVANPILAFSLFEHRVFRAGTAALFLLGGVFLGVVMFVPLFMVNVIGTTATKAGASLMPLTLGVVAGSLTAGQLVSRFGHYKRWMIGGASLLLVGLTLLATMPPTITYERMLVYLVVCGLGLGPGMPLYTLAIQNATEPRLLGQATSAAQFARQIGGALAAAAFGAVLALNLHAAGLDAAALRSPAVAAATTSATHEAAAAAPPVRTVRPAPAVRVAFARAITRTYWLAVVLVAAGLVAALFVPELPLRKSNAPADVMNAID